MNEERLYESGPCSVCGHVGMVFARTFIKANLELSRRGWSVGITTLCPGHYEKLKSEEQPCPSPSRRRSTTTRR